MKRGDKVATDGHGAGVVMRVFSNGRVLVDVGTGKINHHGEPNRDAKAFEAKQVTARYEERYA